MPWCLRRRRPGVRKSRRLASPLEPSGPSSGSRSMAVILADIAARRSIRQFDAEAKPARDNDDLAGRRLDNAKLGDETGAALLRHDEHFAVRIVKVTVDHRAVGGVDVDRHAGLRRHVAIAAERHDAFDKVGGLVRNRKRAPAQLRRRSVGVVERRAANQSVVDTRIGPMHDRRLDAIGPSAAVFLARRRKRGAGDQLGIKTVRRALRRIAPDRQCAGNGLRDEVIAKARLVLKLGTGGFAVRISELGFLIHW